MRIAAAPPAATSPENAALPEPMQCPQPALGAAPLRDVEI
jgi:hypothetical protein